MYQTAPSIWTIGRDKPVILGVPFLSHTGPIKKPRGVARPDFHLCTSCFSKYSQTNFCPRTLLRISDPDELVFGPYRYLFCRVPPQPNYPPAGVPSQVSNTEDDGWCYNGAPLPPERQHRRSHLHYASPSASQQQVVVKVHKVSASH
jgi:hypothetical protein